MKLPERTDRILEILKNKKYVTPKHLAAELYCSESTIRRDLKLLEDSELIKRYHGSVSLLPRSNVEQPYNFRKMKFPEEKKYIAKLAKQFISNGDSLFLDSSSTVMNICSHLEEFINLVVITNGIKTAFDLSLNSNINSFLIGGKIKPNSLSVVGSEFTGDFIGNFRSNLSIISCKGIDENGIYEADHNQTVVKRHMIENSDKILLLSDHSKFNKSHFSKLSSFEEIDIIITNKKPPKNILESLDKYNTRILWT